MYTTIKIEPIKVTEIWEKHFTSNISLSDMTQHHGTSPAHVHIPCSAPDVARSVCLSGVCFA